MELKLAVQDGYKTIPEALGFTEERGTEIEQLVDVAMRNKADMPHAMVVVAQICNTQEELIYAMYNLGMQNEYWRMRKELFHIFGR